MAGPALFGDLDCISQPTQDVITSMGFTRTTPVQEAVIPLFCGNKDVAVDACTGSGKTLAFLVPVIERLRRLEEPLKKHQVGAIVVSPTRELARQIHTVAQPFVESVPGLSMLLLVGGSDPGQDVAQFKEQGGNVIVGTPGRIDDVMKRCATMDCKRLEVFVLDEADRLLDMGFRVQLDAIMSRLPKQRRTGLFSATQTEAVQALARAGLRNPVRVNVAVTAAQPASGKSKGSAAGKAQPNTAALQQKTPTGLHISFTQCEVDQKLAQLVRFLQLHANSNKIIVYCLTCACVDFYALALKRLAAHPALQGALKGVQVRALHGRMKQSAREGMLDAFTKLPAGVLLATDLAARGLDIPEVQWVVQLDPPQDPDAFVHRVGRTARAGRAGAALVYLAPHEATYTEFLRLRKVPMEQAEALDSTPDVLPALRQEAEGDREVMEAGMKAFVSYIRGYKEHHCKFIFRAQELPIGRLATSFALLRLPHMPEVKRVLTRTESGSRAAGIPTCEHFTPSEVDPDLVAFKDKAREKQRQQKLKKQAEQQRAAAAKAVKPHASQQAGQQAGPHDKAAGPVQDQASRLTAAKRRKLQARDELEELDAEYKLLKKLKRGKLSEHQFDVATGLTSDSDLDELEAARQPAASDSHSDEDGDGVKAPTVGRGAQQKKGAGSVGARDQQQHRPKGLVQRAGPTHLGQKLEARTKKVKRKAKKQQRKQHV